MTFRIVVCHISFLKFEYFTQRRGEEEYAEVFLPHKSLSLLCALGLSLPLREIIIAPYFRFLQ